MVDLLGPICAAPLLLSIVIIAHEIGHFIAARLTGIRVVSVCFGLGPVLFRWKVGEAFLTLDLLPGGGFVRPLHKLSQKSRMLQGRGKTSFFPFSFLPL